MNPDDTGDYVDLRNDGLPIDAIRSHDLPWNYAISELVDNALDAYAKRVVMILEKRRIIIDDDGVGVKDTQALLMYGRHDPHPSTQTGRFGVGAKLALYRGDQIDITTVREGLTHTVSVSVPILRKNAKKVSWPRRHQTPSPSGTHIEISKIPSFFPEIRLRDVRAFLAKVYTPGINDGRQILIGADAAHLEPLAAWTPPLQTDIIEMEHDFGDGRRFRCRAGLIQDPKAEGRGTFAAYGFRHLDDSQLGLEESPGARVHVAVHLMEDHYKAWRLDTHKRKLLDVHAADVSAVLKTFLAPLLAKEREQRRNLKIDGANRLLELMFGTASDGGVIPKPGPGSVKGGPWGGGDGVAPNPAKNVTPITPAIKKTRRLHPKAQGITIVADHLGDDDAFLYKQSSTTIEVRFNVDHLWWKQIGDNEQTIASNALLIYEFNQRLRKYTGDLPYDFDAVGRSFGKKLASINLLQAAAKAS